MINKFKNAFKGGFIAFKDKSIIIQMILGLITIVFGLIFRFSYEEWLAVLICVGLVISLEIFNTCIEKTCDLISTKKDERIRVIKDLSSFGVLFMCFISLIIFIIIVVRRFL